SRHRHSAVCLLRLRVQWSFQAANANGAPRLGPTSLNLLSPWLFRKSQYPLTEYVALNLTGSAKDCLRSTDEHRANQLRCLRTLGRIDASVDTQHLGSEVAEVAVGLRGH